MVDNGIHYCSIVTDLSDFKAYREGLPFLRARPWEGTIEEQMHILCNWFCGLSTQRYSPPLAAGNMRSLPHERTKTQESTT